MPSRPTNTSLLAILVFAALGSAPTLGAQQVSSHTLVFAVYQGEQTAGDVLANLQKTQHAAGERLESYTVISKREDGKITLRQPPTTADATIALMTAQLATPVVSPQVVDSLKASLMPGSSAVIAYLNDRWAADFQRDLEAARARAVMASMIEQDVEDPTP